MKKLFLFIFFAVTILFLGNSKILALSPSVTPKTPASIPTPSDVINKLKQIQILKEKIATKVAEIREKEKKALLGTIKTIEKENITIFKNGVEKMISVSEDTLFYNFTKDGKAETNSKSLKVGSDLAVFGYTGEGTNKLAAKYIFIQTFPTVIIGKIADIDKSNYTITVHERQGNRVVDVETYTKSFTYTKQNGKTKIGFSKLKIGDTVHIIGSPNPKEENRLIASAILALSFTPQSTPSSVPAKETTSSVTPKPKATLTPKITSAK